MNEVYFEVRIKIFFKKVVIKYYRRDRGMEEEKGDLEEKICYGILKVRN